MTLFYYDKETRIQKFEVVSLVDETWPIATIETPEEFKLHYLTKTVKNEERRRVLLPKLTDMKFGPLLPKKMEKGLVYKLSDKKVTDLQALSKFVSNEGERWIRELVERQKNL